MFDSNGSTYDRSRLPGYSNPAPLRFGRDEYRPSDTFSVDASNALDADVPGLLGDDREGKLESIVEAVMEAMKETAVWKWLEQKQASECQKNAHMNRRWAEMQDFADEDADQGDLDYLDEPEEEMDELPDDDGLDEEEY